MSEKESIKTRMAWLGSSVSKKFNKHDLFMHYLFDFGELSDPLKNIVIGDEIKSYNENKKQTDGQILISSFHPNVQRLIWAHAVNTRGYEPIIFRCESDLSICFWKNLTKTDSFKCETCVFKSRQLLNSFGLENKTVPISRFENKNCKNRAECVSEISKEYKYDGVDISQYAHSTMKKYFKKWSINLEDRYESVVYDSILEESVNLVDVTNNLFDEYNIKAVVGGDPYYFYDGIIFAVAEKNNVPAVTISTGKRRGKRMLGFQSNREPSFVYTDDGLATQYVNSPLTKEEKRNIGTVMDDRKEGENVSVDYTKFSNSSSKIKNNSSNTIGLFTNLLWDAALESRNVVFSSPFAWVENTINLVSNLKDTELIIKTHPAEKIRGTNESMSDWLKDKYDPIPEYVTLLEPDTDISPYQLFEIMDLGIVYNSIIGLEMAYDGIPVIVSSDAHYRGLGFTEDPSSLEDYKNLINKLDELTMTSEAKQRAERYAHLFFIKRHFEYPYNIEEKEETIKIRHDDIKPGNEPFDSVVESILEGEPVFK